MQLFRAYVDSSNFSFEAYGHGRKGAQANLAQAIRKHASQTGADTDWVNDAIADIVVYEIDSSHAYRDRERL